MTSVVLNTILIPRALAVSAFTDFLLSILPIIVFKELHIDRKSKIILCVLMGLGVL